MRACTHRGWRTPTTSQHNILTRKNSFALRTGLEPLIMESIGSRDRRSSNWAEPPRSPFVALILSLMLQVSCVGQFSGPQMSSTLYLTKVAEFWHSVSVSRQKIWRKRKKRVIITHLAQQLTKIRIIISHLAQQLTKIRIIISHLAQQLTNISIIISHWA